MRFLATLIFFTLLANASAQRRVILAANTSGWQVLHSLDENNLGTDPAQSDPDFNTTWMTLGLADSTYDGPVFTPEKEVPFRIAGINSGPGGTTLAHPGENRAGAVYFVKEITGPEKGAWSLDFNLTTPRAYQIFLNGELIVDHLGLGQPASSWNFTWQNQARRPSQKPAALRPGKNILAISLHPETQNSPALDFDLTLTALTDFGDPASLPEMLPLADPSLGDSVTTIQWFTATPSVTSLRFGPTRDSMTKLITLSDSTFVHTAHIPNPPAGQRLYYEILRSDGSSFNPPSVNSLVLPRATILPFRSQWAYLDPRDPATEASLDPALGDPDFNQTWSTQSFGNYPGNATYDGPAFSNLLPAPFGSADGFLKPETATPNPGPLWFIKEIDGGPTGYHQLRLTGVRDNPITVFLNGEKIGGTIQRAASQAIWAQRGTSNSGLSISPPANLTLPPGPNLIAVLLHRPVDDSTHHTFDLQLTGLPLAASNSFLNPIATTANSLNLAWSTNQPQPTRLRWGTALSALTESTNIPGNQTYHTHLLPNLEPSTTYFVEALASSDQSHTPPVLASFRTRDPIILSRQSTGWSLLESISEGTFVDPSLADLDFLTTWHTPEQYDGPAFAPNQTSPFITQGHYLRPNQTTLQTIEDKIRPVWLVKEINGGETGYQSLTLDGIFNRGFAAFLNGELIAAPNLQANEQLGSWNLHSNINSSTDLNFSFQIAQNVTVKPGANTFAIALHPTRFDLPGTLTGEFELRGVPTKISLTPPALEYLSSTQLTFTWSTSQPTSTRFSYGLDPLAHDSIIENPDFKTDHQITSINLTTGGTYTFEILATDAQGNTATFVGTFQIPPQILRQPFLQKAAPTTMTVNWRTRGPGDTLLQFGRDPASLDQLVIGTSALAPLTFANGPNEVITDHSVTLRNLTPATRYYYQIAEENSPAPARDSDQYFTTPPPVGTPADTRIWVIGDAGYAGERVNNVKDAYLQFTGDTPTDVWLMLGDNAYNSGTDSEYQASVFNTFPELIKKNPIWPTMGNHDGYSKQYYGIFDLPVDGVSGGIPSGTEKYYSFDHGNIHFICLNSEEDPGGMIDWLESDLQATRADWLIAFFHHGPYTKGSHDSDRESEHLPARQKYLPILESYGVDLVLSGHSHNYERSHLIDGHYQFSNSFLPELHTLDPGPGSSLGVTDRTTGLFRHTPEYGPYQKPLATPNAGQISATVGASSTVGRWSDTDGGDQNAITHPNPHPVHVATLRALGSMVIDVKDHSLQSYYLDSNGQIRDHFEIQKSPATGPAITWWQDHFGPDSYPHFPDWLADLDGDTHNNFAEFAHGGDPRKNEQLIEATLTREEGPNNETIEWFTVQYDLREGTDATVKASQNLVQFIDSGIETQRLTEPNPEGIARYQSRIRRTNQRTLFFQITLSR